MRIKIHPRRMPDGSYQVAVVGQSLYTDLTRDQAVSLRNALAEQFSNWPEVNEVHSEPFPPEPDEAAATEAAYTRYASGWIGGKVQ